MRALDIYCGAGGATRGLMQAGFHVTGVDHKPQRNYCGDVFVQMDALEYLATADLSQFQFIWASPPCQRFTALKVAPNAKADKHLDLIMPTRALLRQSCRPYVIENVEGAGAMLIDPVKLCGSMFGLEAPSGSLQRHRVFETNFPLTAPSTCQHGWTTIGIYGAHVRDRRRPAGKNHRPGSNLPREHAYIAFGVPDGSMTLAELSEAIPPAYSRYIAETFLKGAAGAFEPVIDAPVVTSDTLVIPISPKPAPVAKPVNVPAIIEPVALGRRDFYRTSAHPRLPHDNYPTPPELTAALLVGLDRLGIELPFPAFDPCAGEGKLLAALGGVGFGSDLFPESYPRRPWIHEDPIDARDVEAIYEALGPCRSIVTNPPTEDDEQAGKRKAQAPKNALERRYRKSWPPYAKKELAADIAYASMRLLELGAIELFALLLHLPFEAACRSRRLALMRSRRFRGRIVPCWRPRWIEGTKGNGTMNHAWLVWAREGTSNTTVYVSREPVEGPAAEALKEPKPPRPRQRKPTAQLELPWGSDADADQGADA